MNKYTIKYEFLNTLYNGYSIFFGSVFPVALIHLIRISVNIINTILNRIDLFKI